MTADRRKWDPRFMAVAALAATWSKDPAEGVGAALVSPDLRQLSLGYNGLPRGVEDTPERLADPEHKRELTVHAELNAILNCHSHPTGWTLYATKHPCLECAKHVIQAGVARVVCPPPSGNWSDLQHRAASILHEAGVAVQWWEADR